jgi:WD40 repeat protein
MPLRLILSLLVVALASIDAPIFAQSNSKAAYQNGQAVEVKWGNSWWKAKILELKANGGAKIQYDFDNSQEEVAADRIRPLEGAAPPALAKPTAEERTWTDATGKFKIQAQFVKQDGDQIELLRTDGKTIKLPFEKLSPADKEYVKKQTTDSDPDNPFKVEEDSDSPFKAASPSARPKMPAKGERPNDPFSNADESQLKITPIKAGGGSELIIEAPSSFGYSPDPAPASSFSGPNRGLMLSSPAQQDASHNAFWDHIKGVIFDESKQRAIVAHMSEQPGQAKKTRIERLDLAKGESLGAVDSIVNFIPVDFDPVTQLILGRSDNFHHGTKDRLDIWELGDNELKHRVSFKPYAGGQGGGWKDVSWARFVGASHIGTLGADNRFILWETKNLKQVYAATLWAGCEPALSGTGKYLAVITKDGAYVLETLSGNVVAKLAGQPGYFPKLSFSPDGKKLACASNDRLIVWDMTSGQIASEVYYPKPSQVEEVLWPAEGGVILSAGNQLRLIDLDKKVVLWTYQTGEATQMFGGRLWSVVNAHGAAGKSLVHVQIPDAKAKEMQASLSGKDLLALKPGTAVGVFINVALSEPDRVRIYDHILAQLKEAGITLDQNSPISIEAATEQGKTESVNYRSFGSPRFFGPGGETANVTQTISRITIREKGKILWEAKQIAGAPHMINQKEGQSLQQAISAATGPNANYFLSLLMPKQLARHPDNGTYGSSTLTPQGLK